MICSPSNDRSTRFARAAGSKVVLISVSETTGAKDYSPAVPYGSRLAVRRASPRDMTSASGCRLSLCSRDRRTAAMPSSRKARAILSRVVGVSSAIGRGSHLDRGSGLLGVFNPAGRPASSHAFGTTARGLPGGGVGSWLAASSRAMALLRNRKFADSPLEEGRFELAVPPRWRAQPARRFSRYLRRRHRRRTCDGS
jgi:hypothetical protein